LTHRHANRRNPGSARGRLVRIRPRWSGPRWRNIWGDANFSGAAEARRSDLTTKEMMTMATRHAKTAASIQDSLPFLTNREPYGEDLSRFVGTQGLPHHHLEASPITLVICIYS